MIKNVWRLYQFPMATITNYHNHSGLKQYKVIVLQFYVAEVQNRSHWSKIKVLPGLCSFWRLLTVLLSPFLTLTFLPPFYKDPRDDIGSTQTNLGQGYRLNQICQVPLSM